MLNAINLKISQKKRKKLFGTLIRVKTQHICSLSFQLFHNQTVIECIRDINTITNTLTYYQIVQILQRAQRTKVTNLITFKMQSFQLRQPLQRTYVTDFVECEIQTFQLRQFL